MTKHPHIPHKPVSSSQIKSIGHCPATNVLSIEFKSGGVYHYADVDAAKHQKMVDSDSCGSFLHSEIKGKHPHTKVS